MRHLSVATVFGIALLTLDIAVLMLEVAAPSWRAHFPPQTLPSPLATVALGFLGLGFLGPEVFGATVLLRRLAGLGILAVVLLSFMTTAVMMPNAVVAFFLLAVSFWAWSFGPHRWSGLLLQLLCVSAGLFGLLDLIAWLFDLAPVYAWYTALKMPAVTAAAVAAASAMMCFVSASERAASEVGEEDQRIVFLGGTVLLVIALGAGFIGFGILAQQVERIMVNALRTALHSRAQVFHHTIDRAWDDAFLVVQRPHLNALLKRFDAGAAGMRESEDIQAIVDNIVTTTDVVALRLFGAKRNLIAERGFLVQSAPFDEPLHNLKGARLVWQGRSLLHVDLPLRDVGRDIGRLQLEIALPLLDELMSDPTGLGKTGAVGLCALRGDSMQCLPGRGNDHRPVRHPRKVGGHELPMSRALRGEAGVDVTMDVRRVEVVTAFMPLGETGFGMLVKAHRSEMFEPIRHQFQRVLVLLLMLVIVGVVLLRWQVAPLVRKLLHEINERKAAEQKLAHLANHDTLTDLPNRSLFTDRLKQATAEAARRQTTLAVMFLDLDRFKLINDTLGHAVGDLLLKAVADRIRLCLRASDTVSRLGGDEFTVLLHEVGAANDAAAVAQKILDNLALPFSIAGRELFVTVSIGITVLPNDGNSVDALLKNADIAMYRAKEFGRNNFQFFRAEMNQRAQERLALESSLRRALEREELVLHYQPQIDLASGRIVGVEALVRWRHPEQGIILPSHFIPMAEENGLIVPLGEWVLRTAASQARTWLRAGFDVPRVHVNLSAQQFRQANLVQTVLLALRDHDLSAQHLGLEITETVVMQNAEWTRDILRELHAFGIELSIDDFGTGYSSLSYLKRFPIDCLKIDRAFVHELETDPDDAALCNAIISMAHSLGIKVIAEGVETAGQLAFLRARRCDLIQGAYYSGPVSADMLAQYLSKEGGRSAPAAVLHRLG